MNNHNGVPNNKDLTGGTLSMGHSDEDASINSHIEGDVEDFSNHESVMSEDTRASPHSLRSSSGGDVTVFHKNRDDGGEVILLDRENQYVSISRLMIITVLVLITVGISVTVFVYVDGKEVENYLSAYEENTIKVFEDLGLALSFRFAQLDVLAVAVASYAATSGNSSVQWPMVTLPDYAVRVAKIRSLFDAVAVEQFPIVPNNGDDRKDWEDYAKRHGNEWIREAVEVQLADDSYHGMIPSAESLATSGSNINETAMMSAMRGIQYRSQILPPNSGPYTPLWQAYPIVPASPLENSVNGTRTPFNWNMASDPFLGPAINHTLTTRRPVLTQVLNMVLKGDSADFHESAKATNDWASHLIDPDADPSEPLVQLLYPILDTATAQAQGSNATSNLNNTKVLGFLSASVYFSTLLKDILPQYHYGLMVVLSNDCGQSFTYQVDGGNVTYLGQGNRRTYKYTDMNTTAFFDELSDYYDGTSYYSGLPVSDEYCLYNVTTYSTAELEAQYRSSDPIIFTYSVIIIFVVTACCFFGYDRLVTDRQRKVMRSAQKSNAIISSLFPSTVRDRLYDGAGDDSHPALFQPNKARLKNFLNDGTDGAKSGKSNSHAIGGSKPIADLFTDCTVMFADIANFTAWSSVREPGQVFTLLETLYGAFDRIAARRGVFKVETIGDSYVAVTGLPEPRLNHAVVMARFARECRQQCIQLSRELETTLGPDTGELRMRFGLNSGPVTAGVLRGERSRFQLFGDTVNTAARMESTGFINKIHISQSTADLLIKDNKGHWISSRKDKIEAKGKGWMQTYWVEPGNRHNSRGAEFQETKETRSVPADLDGKTERLVDWNVVVLSRMITQIIAHRNSRTRRKSHMNMGQRQGVVRNVDWTMPKDAMVLHEVKEIIELPDFDAALREQDPRDVALDQSIQSQLRDYVSAIALTYHDNPFHNFEHASHVCMSVAKLLSRIVAPDQVYDKDTGDTRILASNLHDHTYGITSDPLTQFACVFAALIHDAGHPGVPNSQLVKEETEMAKTYKGKSVAEQNSVNLAWHILLQDKYKDLRAAICDTQEEEMRFRQLVVNSVMATDIMDGDLKKLREERWKKAFKDRQPVRPSITVTDPFLDDVPGEHHDDHDHSDERASVNRKATIVIEHLIQASDVAHTMQHWHIYRKWNERLFSELHHAYVQGRAEKDPAEFWYQGEIGFFDFYIIPLAKKLSECGVFGVSSDEYLNYAIQNRNEWEKKGLSVVEEMLENLGAQNSVSSTERSDSVEN